MFRLQAAIAGEQLLGRPVASKASLQWLWDSYRETGSWTALAASTRRQRVWLDVLLYTGPRRGDAVQIGRQHVKQIVNEDGSFSRIATFKTEKSGELVTVTMPILDVLWKTLEIGPTGDPTWICGARGRPLAKEAFANDFSEAARQAGVKKERPRRPEDCSHDRGRERGDRKGTRRAIRLGRWRTDFRHLHAGSKPRSSRCPSRSQIRRNRNIYARTYRDGAGEI